MKYCLPLVCFRSAADDKAELHNSRPIIPFNSTQLEDLQRYAERHPCKKVDNEGAFRLTADFHRSTTSSASDSGPAANLTAKERSTISEWADHTNETPQGSHTPAVSEQKSEHATICAQLNQLAAYAGLHPYPEPPDHGFSVMERRGRSRKVKLVRQEITDERPYWILALERALTTLRKDLHREQRLNGILGRHDPGFVNDLNIDDPEGRLYRGLCESS